MTKTLGKSSAKSKAISLLFSINFTLNPLNDKSLEVLKPILLPPKIMTSLTGVFVLPVILHNSSPPPAHVINTALSPSLNSVSPLGIIVYWVPKRCIAIGTK